MSTSPQQIWRGPLGPSQFANPAGSTTTFKMSYPELLPEIELIPSMLPPGEDMTFPESSFFKQPGSPSLPSPAQVRLMADKSDSRNRSLRSRAQISFFPDLQLLVKWGQIVVIEEGQCLWALGKLLPDSLPVPEVYGWCRDGDEFFIYMQLVRGETLENRWGGLSIEEKNELCKELREMVLSLRRLRQDTTDPFIGSIAGRSLKEIIFAYNRSPAGPFRSVESFHDFFVHLPAVYDRSSGEEAHPMRDTLSDDMRIVFTHGDLHPSNILVRAEGAPHIAAIIDWHQSGWFPEYWEFCKAQWVSKFGEEWQAEYLPKIMEPRENYNNWDYFVLKIGL